MNFDYNDFDDIKEVLKLHRIISNECFYILQDAVSHCMIKEIAPKNGAHYPIHVADFYVDNWNDMICIDYNYRLNNDYVEGEIEVPMKLIFEKEARKQYFLDYFNAGL